MNQPQPFALLTPHTVNVEHVSSCGEHQSTVLEGVERWIIGSDGALTVYGHQNPLATFASSTWFSIACAPKKD